MAAAPLSQCQKDGLLVLKARRSEEENLQPLTKLAMRSVARNINYFASIDKPFEDLPRSVLADMVSYEPLVPLLRCPRYAHLVVTKHTDSVVLDFSPSVLTWTEHHVERVCKLVENSEVPVRNLVVHLSRDYSEPSRPKTRREGAPQLSTARLHELLRHLPHLVTFNCDLAEFCTQEDCGVTNATLTVLATTCPKLRVLRVWGPFVCGRSKTITKEGVTELCAACPELEVLDIPLPSCVRQTESYSYLLEKRGIKPTPNEYIQFVLPLVPRLWRLHFPYNGLEPSDLLSYIEHHGATHPQLRYDLDLPKKLEEVHTIAKAFPRCHRLWVTNRSDLDLTPVLQFKELRELIVESIEGENSGLGDTLPPVLAQTSLTSFALAEVKNFSLDMSLVAHHCPELEDLRLVNHKISKKQQHGVLPCHFRFLNDVYLSELPLSPAALPVVARMLSSPRLAILGVCYMSVPDVLFSSLAREAREHRQVFSALEEFTLLECRVRPETLMDVLLQAPRLRRLMLSEVDKKYYKSVVTFVKKHLQRVTLEWEMDYS